jgi:TonB family protein
MRISLRLCLSLAILVSWVLVRAQVSTLEGSPRDRLDALYGLTDLERPGLTPWHMNISFQLYDLYGKPTEKGTIEEWWLKPGLRKIVVTSPSFNEIVPAPAGAPQPVSSREAVLVYLLLSDIVQPVRQLPGLQSIPVDTVQRKFGQLKAECLEIGNNSKAQIEHGETRSIGYCLDPSSGQLRLRLSDVAESVVRNRPGHFQHTDVAVDTSITYHDRPAIFGHINTLESIDPSSVSITVATASHVQIVPNLALASNLIHKVSATYPKLVGDRRRSGPVVLAVRISISGDVTAAEVIATPDPAFSNAAVNAVRQWKYQPYDVDGKLAEVTSLVTINFLPSNNRGNLGAFLPPSN